MKNIIAFVVLFASLNGLSAQESKIDYPVYTGKDLGLTYTPTAATFKIWAPTATAAKLNIYKSDLGGTAVRSITMNKELMVFGKLLFQKILKIAITHFK